MNLLTVSADSHLSTPTHVDDFMRTPLFALLILFLAAPIFAPSAHSQDIETGTWTGFIMPPGQDALDITVDVAVESDTLKMTLNGGGPIGNLPLLDIDVKDDGINFAFEAGIRILCDLKLKANNGYEGECAPEGQESGILVMNPPKKDGN